MSNFELNSNAEFRVVGKWRKLGNATDAEGGISTFTHASVSDQRFPDPGLKIGRAQQIRAAVFNFT